MRSLLSVISFLSLLASAAAAGSMESGRAVGADLNFTSEKVFDDLYRLRGSDLNVEARRDSFPSQQDAKYRVSGRLFGQEIPTQPGEFVRDAFGIYHRTMLKAAGMHIVWERNTAVREMIVYSKLDAAVKPEGAVALTQLLNILPEFAFTKAAQAKSGFVDLPQGGLRYTIRERFSGELAVDDVGSSVSIRFSQWGGGTLYEFRGSAFGRDFSRDSLTIQTDPNFLGARGYRAEGCGMDIEVRDHTFGGIRRLEIRGQAGDNVELATLVMSVVRYIAGR